MPPPDGIIVLGGALRGGESEARGQVVFSEGERVVEAAILAKRYPDARVIFSGGSGSLLSPDSRPRPRRRKSSSSTSASIRRAITLEDESRNTDENARFTAALVRPQPTQRLLLVTSAFHMPRSMGLFEKAGFNVMAFPVAFRTLGEGRGAPVGDGSGAQPRDLRDSPRKEWIGLVAYWATGRIDRLFPGPGDVASTDRRLRRRRIHPAYSAEGAPRR